MFRKTVLYRAYASFIFMLLLPSCGDDLTFIDQMREAEAKADTVLLDRHLCPSYHVPCSAGNTLFVTPHYGGMIVDIWNVNDHEIIDELSRIFKDEFDKTPTMSYLGIRVYNIPFRPRIIGKKNEENVVYAADAVPVTNLVWKR